MNEEKYPQMMKLLAKKEQEKKNENNINLTTNRNFK